jgi:hypothetical protein
MTVVVDVSVDCVCVERSILRVSANLNGIKKNFMLECCLGSCFMLDNNCIKSLRAIMYWCCGVVLVFCLNFDAIVLGAFVGF